MCIHKKCYPYVIKVKSSNRIPWRNSFARGLRIWIVVLPELPPWASFLIPRVGTVTEPILKDVARMKITRLIANSIWFSIWHILSGSQQQWNFNLSKLIDRLSEVIKRKEILLFSKHNMFQAFVLFLFFFPLLWNTCMAPFCYSYCFDCGRSGFLLKVWETSLSFWTRHQWNSVWLNSRVILDRHQMGVSQDMMWWKAFIFPLFLLCVFFATNSIHVKPAEVTFQFSS